MEVIAQIAFMTACIGILVWVSKHASEPRFGQPGDRAVGMALLLVLFGAAAIGILIPSAIAKNIGDGEVGIIGRLSQVVSTISLVLAAIRGWNILMGLVLAGIVGWGVLWVFGVKL